MKRVFMLIVILVSMAAAGQEIKFKDGKVLVDGKECLKYDDSDPNHVSISDLEGNEIIFMKFIHNSRYGSVYNKITFIGQKLTFTSQSYVFTKKLLVKKLLSEKVLVDCKFDPAKAEVFVMKYDENIEK